MLKYLIGAALAAIMLTATPVANAADDPTFTVPQWDGTDVPPMSVSVRAISWRKVVVRRFCLKTVTRVWERRGKQRWHLVSKHVLPHHAPIEGCRRDRR